ncbi:hypothetical protein KEM55_004876 [Ascosphaera atra]|nr:hypothetical protein KEM55_004876 [Ascosphaera atra]
MKSAEPPGRPSRQPILASKGPQIRAYLEVEAPARDRLAGKEIRAKRDAHADLEGGRSISGAPLSCSAPADCSWGIAAAAAAAAVATDDDVLVQLSRANLRRLPLQLEFVLRRDLPNWKHLESRARTQFWGELW